MGSGADSPCQGEMARRARGGRVGDYEHEVLLWSRPPAILWFLSHRWERNSPRRAKPSAPITETIIIAPSSGPSDQLPPEGEA